MNKKQNKVVEFVKEHKKEVAIGVTGAAAIVCGIVYFAVNKKTYVPVKFSGVLETLASRDIPIDDWSVGTLTDCWRESGWINAIAKDFTVADAGKLGDELLKIDGVTMDTAMQVVLSVPDVKVD
jgi:hypothetical protein